MSERRRAREAAQQPSEPLAPSDLDERTVAVDRSASLDDSTVVVDRAAELEEHTVVVDREPVSGATLRQETEDDDEATSVVQRRDASLLVDDETVAADRGWLPEGTVRVGGAPAQGFSGPLAGLGQAPAARTNRFAPPTGGRRAVLGPGAGATSRYTTRRVVAPAPPTAPIAQAAEATRDPQAALPSVRRRARRGAIVSLVSAAGALVVAIGGLAIVIPLLLAG
ncbi:MAG: hypothetical protein ABW204_00150 [Microbacteriaceae bacterium]